MVYARSSPRTERGARAGRIVLEEVCAILGYVRTPHNRAFPSTIYACGLRLQEAQHLEISYIDTIAPGAQWEARSAPGGGPTRRSAVNSRMMVPVHRGKEAKDSVCAAA